MLARLYCTDGSYAVGLAVGSDGNVYGATMEGGTGCLGEGCGTIFRVTLSTGAYEVMLSFTSANEGFPAGLTAASDGSLYGLMINGNALFHYLSSRDSVESTQLSFPSPKGCPGFACFASNFLTFGPNENLYGVYTVYDAPGAAGIFELQPDGSHLQLLPEFTTTTGAGPQLLLGSDGNFWFPQSWAPAVKVTSWRLLPQLGRSSGH